MADLIVLAVFLTVGYVFGRIAETRHYKSIKEREQQYRYLPAISSRIPPVSQPADASILVTGSVVISVDYFKRFLASLRTLIGGRVISYESLLDRARREAILRMKQQAESFGADKVFNIKLETASISKNAKGKIGSIEVLAYGTALVPVEPDKR
ncbi:MAG TPA: YbjQ family protein [Gammaproteobacteria bacterium]|nr:YbjQ family protein [Gammaproteobacteria bacterium]